MIDAAMPHPPLARRVEILEEKVDALSLLPARVAVVETQLVAIRGDINSLRVEMSTMRDELRAEIRTGDEETRRHMRVLHEDVISRMALLQEGLDRRNGDNRRSAHKRTPPKRRR